MVSFTAEKHLRVGLCGAQPVSYTHLGYLLRGRIRQSITKGRSTLKLIKTIYFETYLLLFVTTVIYKYHWFVRQRIQKYELPAQYNVFCTTYIGTVVSVNVLTNATMALINLQLT